MGSGDPRGGEYQREMGESEGTVYGDEIVAVDISEEACSLRNGH